jgi:preprotein translocase subunit YajC
MILILGFGALLIFFMMNSRKKQRQQQEKLSTGLVPGARVMTSFGVFGTVVEVLPEENKVVIESGPGTVLTVHRQAIGTIEQPVADTPLDDELGGTEVPDDLSSLTPVDEDRTETTEPAAARPPRTPWTTPRSGRTRWRRPMRPRTRPSTMRSRPIPTRTRPIPTRTTRPGRTAADRSGRSPTGAPPAPTSRKR